jgi:ArsR family transcriptional regulator
MANTPGALRRAQIVSIARALADPTRFEIFQQIAAGDCVACSDLREHLDVSAPTISHHLKELEAAGLIKSERAGKFVNLTLRRDLWRAYVHNLSTL